MLGEVIVCVSSKYNQYTSSLKDIKWCLRLQLNFFMFMYFGFGVHNDIHKYSTF